MLYRSFFKPLLDRLVAFFALIILSPLLIILAFLVRIKLGSPVFFSQIRPGKDERPFKLYKFRTMNNRTDSSGKLLDDAQRLTRFGRFLRSTSMDELPELINVLAGKMSFVGPRPLLMQYLPLYNDFQKRRHEIKPGLTGLAQVNGRNAIRWDDKFALDVEYVDRVSFFLDIRILLMTVKSVFLREGINAGESVTMEVFRGSPPQGNSDSGEVQVLPEPTHN